MKIFIGFIFSFFLSAFLLSASSAQSATNSSSSPSSSSLQKPSAIHAFVALCDSTTMSIPGVSARLADGNDLNHNIFWSGKQGFKTFFQNSQDWELLLSIKNYDSGILERAFFRHRSSGALMVADAYRGASTRNAIMDFLEASAGGNKKKVKTQINGKDVIFKTGGDADTLIYFGHNGLMDFTVDPAKLPAQKDDSERYAMVVSEYSKSHFGKLLEKTGAQPLLLIDGLITPVAYIPGMILDSLLSGDSIDKMRNKVILEYDTRQTVGYNTAEQMFKILQ